MAALPERRARPRVARALMSPLGIALGAAGGTVAFLAGLPVAGAVVVGVAAWAARVAVAVGRQAPRSRIDPFAVGEPWRRFVSDALQAQARYRHALTGTRPGPLRERLSDIGGRIDAAVDECWRIAQQGHVLEKGLRTLNVRSVERQLAELGGDPATSDDASLARTADALRAQLAAAERLRTVATDARDRLRLLDARLNESVARATELSLGAVDGAVAGQLGADVESVVDEMEALRRALEEVGRPPPATAAG